MRTREAFPETPNVAMNDPKVEKRMNPFNQVLMWTSSISSLSLRHEQK